MTQKKRVVKTTAVVLGAAAMLAIAPIGARAGDWGFSIHLPFRHYRHFDPYYVDYHHYDHDYRPGYYYPRYNPIVERDVVEDGYVDYRGRRHGQTTVEDRRASYYSRGRNDAITSPRTSVREERGRNFRRTQEHTSWIGADGRPHSTTIDRVTTVDPWGNTHTDRHVTLKNKRGNEDRKKTRDVKPKGHGNPGSKVKEKTK